MILDFDTPLILLVWNESKACMLCYIVQVAKGSFCYQGLNSENNCVFRNGCVEELGGERKGEERS